MALERELHNAQAEMSVGCIQGADDDDDDDDYYDYDCDYDTPAATL